MASISTPVRSKASAAAVIVIPPSAKARATSTRVSETGWHRGMSSDVRLAP
jgi:hypothetical protein